MRKNNNSFILIRGGWPYVKNIEPLLAKYLKNKTKLKVIILAKTLQDKRYLEKNFKSYYDIVSYNSKDIDASNYENKALNESIEKNALEIEKKYNSSIYRMYFTSRVVGRGFFASGGVRHPRNKTHHYASNNKILSMAINDINFWENLFETHDIKLALNLSPHAHKIALKYKVCSLTIYECKFSNAYGWSDNIRLGPKVSIKDFNNIKTKNIVPVKINKPYQGYLNARKKEKDRLKLTKVFYYSFRKILQYFHGTIKKYRKINNSFLLDEFLYIWRWRNSFLKSNKLVQTNLASLRNKKFIFFPLLTEPEIALHGTADDFFFQLSSINLLSRDLPADYVIVVKEHVLAMGRRPESFYRQIIDLKNVLFADFNEWGIDYVKQSAAVACITGTAAWEAAVIGKPVITFSKNNEFNFLKHVFVVKNFDNLRPIFNDIRRFPNKKSLIDGARFYSAYLKKFTKVAGYNREEKIKFKENDYSSVQKNTAKKFVKDILKILKKSTK